MAGKADTKKPIKPKANPLKAADITHIDYKDTALLRKFISDRGKILRSSRDRRERAGAAQDRSGHQERPRDGPAALRRRWPRLSPTEEGKE